MVNQKKICSYQLEKKVMTNAVVIEKQSKNSQLSLKYFFLQVGTSHVPNFKQAVLLTGQTLNEANSCIHMISLFIL